MNKKELAGFLWKIFDLGTMSAFSGLVPKQQVNNNNYLIFRKEFGHI